MKCDKKGCRKKADVVLEAGFVTKTKRPLCREHFVEWAKVHPIYVSIKIKPA